MAKVAREPRQARRCRAARAMAGRTPRQRPSSQALLCEKKVWGDVKHARKLPNRVAQDESPSSDAINPRGSGLNRFKGNNGATDYTEAPVEQNRRQFVEGAARKTTNET